MCLGDHVGPRWGVLFCMFVDAFSGDFGEDESAERVLVSDAYYACRHHGIEVTIAEPPFDTITKFFDGQECDFESIFSSNLELILLAERHHAPDGVFRRQRRDFVDWESPLRQDSQ